MIQQYVLLSAFCREGGDGRLERQITFDDLTRIQTVTSLTANQKRVVSLLGEGCTQGIIAKRMHVSRSFVSQTVKMLESNNLIKKQSPGTYNSFYDLSTELKTRFKGEEKPRFTHCEPHHIRRKYRILYRSNDLSLDKRAGFVKSWKMRGWQGFKFWFPGKAGEPNITIDINPKSMIVYPDARQKVLAASVEEAENVMNIACHNVVQRFVQVQAKFGVHMEYDEIGQQITQTHYAFPMSKDSPYAASGTTQPATTVDGSPADHGDPDHVEWETTDKVKATALDRAIDKVMGVDSLVKDSIREAMPEAMREFEQQFGPLTSEIKSVMAYVQSGQTAQQQLQQLTFLVAKQLEEINRLKGLKEPEPEPEPEPMTPAVFPTAYAPTYEE